ncbi:MAG TPA: SCO family protein [Anaerolineales bacterium]|nr:SCO family protein [Anaerolineales bacterium]
MGAPIGAEAIRQGKSMRIRTPLLVLLGSLLGFAFVAALVTYFPRADQFNGTVFDPPARATDFNLRTADGSSFQISDQIGKVVLIFFGYTNCPDVCPVTLNDFRSIEEILGEEADGVELVMVTVDPARDTPEVIDEYVRRFSPKIIGLSGTEEELLEIWKGYFVYRAIEGPDSATAVAGAGDLAVPAGYLVDHTVRVYIVDKAGNLRLSYPFAAGAELIASDVRQLLRE